jgi:hypothetical protein
MLRRGLLIAITILELTGCASVQVQRGKDLSTVGIQYTEATIALVDVAIDAMIDADSQALVRTKLPAAALQRPQYAPDKLQEKLDTSNKGLVENTKLYLSLRASLSAVEAYFKALQTLVDNPQSESAGSAVSTLADRVNAISKAVKGIQPVISNEQKTALSGLAKLVANEVHGAKVGAALKRDASVIGEALALQEALMENAETIIVGALNDENARFYVDKVRRPFEKQEIDRVWVTDRKTYIKAKATGVTAEALKSARAASKQMSKSWEKILSGVYDISETRKQIEEVEALVSAMVALKQAEKPKPPAQ